MSVAKLIRRRRQALKLSQAALARAAGVTRQAVTDWEAGKSAPKRKRAALVARALGISPAQLDPLLSQDVITVDTESQLRKIPIMEWDDFALGEQAGVSGEYVTVPGDLPADSQALRVVDAAMAGVFDVGDMIFVSTSTPATPDCYVVASLGGQSVAVLRRYAPRGKTLNGHEVWDLFSTSPDWPTISCNSANGDKVLATVVGLLRMFMRE